MTARRKAFAIALLCLALALRFVGLGSADLVGGDEGYYGTYARNLLEGGFDQLLNLGREPLSAPDNKPFLFPLLLAAAVRLLGPTELALRSVTALAGLSSALFVLLIVRRRYGEVAAGSAGLATLLLPPLVYASRVVMGEGVLAAFGLAGIWAAYRALEERRRDLALFAGALWGCGFLVKLWLVGLFLVPVGVALLADRSRRREPGSWGRLALAALAFVGVASVHLVLVAIFSPATLSHWLDQYFVFSLFGRAGGQEFAGYWHQPWSFYLRASLQTAFMAVPLAAVALTAREPSDTRNDRALPQRPLWFALVAELLLISFMGVKIRQYSFPLLPGLAALAGIGVAFLSRPRDRVRSLAAALVTASAAIVAAVWQWSRPPLFESSILGVAVVLFLSVSAILLVMPERFAAVSVSGVILAAALAGLAGSALTVKRESLAHRTGYREAAALVAPLVAARDPREPVFLAPEVPALQFYLFRTGRYWTTPYEPRSETEILEWVESGEFVAFVTTDRADLYGGPTPPAIVKWLEANAAERTAELVRLAGRPLPIRLFVPAPEEGHP